MVRLLLSMPKPLLPLRLALLNEIALVISGNLLASSTSIPKMITTRKPLLFLKKFMLPNKEAGSMQVLPLTLT